MVESVNKITEKELAEKAVAPRVTEADVLASIKSEDFYVHPGTSFTICVLTLQNGYVVTGEAACADPANYNKDIGERISKDNAVRKIWPLLGYQLRDTLFYKSTSFMDRLRVERLELSTKLDKLVTFTNSEPIFTKLDEKMKELMLDQRDAMKVYLEILDKRISLLTDNVTQ